MTSASDASDSSLLIGQSKSVLETPCLCLDLNRFEANIRQIMSVVSAAGKKWRPHAKCHKSPDIARLLIEHGATGVTCAKVSEAEVFAADGLADLLIAHLPVGTKRLQRLVALCKTASPIVSLDHYVQAQALSAECVRQGTICKALVEVNVGMNRTGVRPGRDTIELAKGINLLPGLELVGIMGYEGHVTVIADAETKRLAIEASIGILAQARSLLRENGLCCDVVSAGGSTSLRHSLNNDVVTETQAGGAMFGDPYYARLPEPYDFQPALTVLATVVSRPSFDRAVLDAGRKAITAEYHPPVVKDWDDARITRQSAEHIVLELGPSSRELRIGDQVELIVGYSDLTTMLHEDYYCFRDDRLEAIWPIKARGKLF